MLPPIPDNSRLLKNIQRTSTLVACFGAVTFIGIFAGIAAYIGSMRADKKILIIAAALALLSAPVNICAILLVHHYLRGILKRWGLTALFVVSTFASIHLAALTFKLKLLLP